MTFLGTDMAHLLWLIPLVMMLYSWAALQRRKATRLFMTGGTNTVSLPARRWKAAIVMAALALLVAALNRPVWNDRAAVVSRRGRDVMFVLDVSRSMLAEDVGESRLAAARKAILDCLDSSTGDRVSLMVFAGDAVMKCPLTHDYGFFTMVVEDASPGSVSRGGTMLGDAVRKAVDDAVRNGTADRMDIVLLTDGDDHGNAPVEAARHAGSAGIRMLVVGVGSESGSPIPIENADGTSEYLEHSGETVISRLNGRMLIDLAAKTPGGEYIHLTSDTSAIGKHYSSLVASAEKREFRRAAAESRRGAHGIFVAGSLFLLGIATCISERTRVARRDTRS